MRTWTTIGAMASILLLASACEQEASRQLDAASTDAEIKRNLDKAALDKKEAYPKKEKGQVFVLDESVAEEWGKAETKPVPNGDWKAYFALLEEAVEYPKAFQETGAKGEAHVMVTVSEKGEMTVGPAVKAVIYEEYSREEMFVRGLKPEQFAETIGRTAKKTLEDVLVAWEPAYADGKPVAVSFPMPVYFK